MKERPILFSGPMVRAILEGRKTQTRRVYKGRPPTFYPSAAGGVWGIPIGERDKCPFGVPADRLIPAMEIPSIGRRYCADIYGKIWSRAKSGGEWRVLKSRKTSKGYLSVTPAINGKYSTKLVHRLVAEAFYGNPSKGQQVRHLDGIRTNNSPENLSWGSASDNWSDRSSAGNGVRQKHHSAKLTVGWVEEIRNSKQSQRKLAQEFGVSQSTISAIKTGETWAQLPAPVDPTPRWASRLTLEITAVRVERLQDISDDDCAAEGIETTIGKGMIDGERCFKFPTGNGYSRIGAHAFQALWDSVYNNWNENPYVWVVEFRKVEDKR